MSGKLRLLKSKMGVEESGVLPFDKWSVTL